MQHATSKKDVSVCFPEYAPARIFLYRDPLGPRLSSYDDRFDGRTIKNGSKLTGENAREDEEEGADKEKRVSKFLWIFLERQRGRE